MNVKKTKSSKKIVLKITMSMTTSRTSRSKARRPGIKARSTNGLLRLLLLHAVGGHGAIKNKAVALRVGMVVKLLGEVGSCC